jgi:hypothetical protein
MKRIVRFINWLFGLGTPNTEKIQELVNKEASEIQEIQKSVSEIKVIHEEISNKLQKCSAPKTKKELVLNPRLSTAQLRLYLMNNGVLETNEMSRKERQYYAKKVYILRYKKNMKIAFDKLSKTYKYFKNGL